MDELGRLEWFGEAHLETCCQRTLPFVRARARGDGRCGNPGSARCGQRADAPNEIVRDSRGVRRRFWL